LNCPAPEMRGIAVTFLPLSPNILYFGYMFDIID
jgi:hypothetical protein